MPEHPRERTPFTEASVAELLRAELVARGLDPHQDMAALMLAQIAFETARGNACDNRNVGNVTVSDSGIAHYYRPPWFAPSDDASPKLKALHAAMLKGKAPRAFQHFDSFEQGVKRYVEVAKSLGCVEGARTGDPEIFASVIARAYTPDAPPSLASTLDKFRRDYIARGLFETLPLDRAPAGAGSDWRSRYS